MILLTAPECPLVGLAVPSFTAVYSVWAGWVSGSSSSASARLRWRLAQPLHSLQPMTALNPMRARDEAG